MDPSLSKPNLLRFGIFELDLKSGELRKAGMKQKLAGQPFQVLRALVERAGEVITREELRGLLWPEHTFVDYELALKKAVNRVRDVLGDSVESPRFIETIPRRGYRFLAEVQTAQADPASPAGRQVRWKLAVSLALGGAAGLLLILTAGKLRTRIFANSRPSAIRSIVVLPLENLSKDPDQDYFSDGMTDALTTELAQIGALRVISRTSAMHFKGTRETLPQIGQELNVDAVVEGSAVRAGDRIRITAQLIDVQTDRHLWAKSYERSAQDVLALQDEVARDIANHIKIRLTPAEQARLSSSGPVDAQAYQSYLEGRYYWNLRTEEGLNKGIEYFRDAIEKDPHYALAYAGLAQSYIVLQGYRIRPGKEAFPKAKAAALKALQMDDGLAEAHAPLAVVKVQYDQDWAAAEQEFKRAIGLNPSYATAHQWYAEEVLSPSGRHKEAIAEMKRALELDPLSMATNAWFGAILFRQGENDQATAQLQKTIEMDKNFPIAHLWLGRVYVEKRMFKQAIEEFRSAVTLSQGQPFYLASLGYAYAVSGDSSEATKILTQLTQLSARKYVPADEVAALCAALGRKDQAFKWLHKACEEDLSSRTRWRIQSDPVFDAMRSDRRYAPLRACSGPPQ